MAWTFEWPWLVVALTPCGREVVQWRCETQRQAAAERDKIQDTIMAGATDFTAAWVAYEGDR